MSDTHMHSPEFLTATAAARRANVAVTSILYHIESGELPVAGKLPGRTGAYLLRPSDVHAFIQRRETKTAPAETGAVAS